jgi:RNA-directed DNA polymerase
MGGKSHALPWEHLLVCFFGSASGREASAYGLQMAAEVTVPIMQDGERTEPYRLLGTERSMHKRNLERKETPVSARSSRPTSGTPRTEDLDGLFVTVPTELPKEQPFPLLAQVLHRDNLLRAYRRVVRNAGAAGVDGISVEQLADLVRKHWPTWQQQLLDGTYVPQPVRLVHIPKGNGKGTRALGIPTVADRLLQQAFLQILQPMFEPRFSAHSYGYRPGRSALDAVKQARVYVERGAVWVVDLDVENFFDRVNHDVLMARVARLIADKRVLLFLRRCLQAGIMEDGVFSQRREGTPQGSPLSPLLSNILLDDLDKELEHREHHFVRYADDCTIYVYSEQAGKRVMSSVETFLSKRLKLKLNREKSAVAKHKERKLLGYRIGNAWKAGKELPKIRIEIAEEKLQNLRKRLKEVFYRGRGRSQEQCIKELNPILRGWVNYFRLTERPGQLKGLDGWVRRHLRCLQWQAWKHPDKRYRELRKAGVSKESAQGAKNRKGAWRNARCPPMQDARNNQWFQQHGLVSLFDVWKG